MANKTSKAKPRLQNLDDLFKLNDGVNPLEQAIPIIMNQPTIRHTVNYIAVDKLTPFKGHPFRLYEGERLDDMVASIKANGVLVPIIARKLGDVLEILSGHNRVEASKLAGLTEVPTIIFENISDEDAMVYVVETNLIQRSFSDMCHSEKAAVIALHHSKMFSQGKRNDIIAQLEMLEKPSDGGENGTCAEIQHKLKARDVVANEYGLKRDTIARYLRVNKLIAELKSLLDNGKIIFTSAVTLSHLSESEQALLADFIEQFKFPVDMKKADMLRKYSEKRRLDGDSIKRILSGTMVHKPNRTPTVKINKTVFIKYFKPNQSAREIEGIVEKALEMYFGNQQ